MTSPSVDRPTGRAPIEVVPIGLRVDGRLIVIVGAGPIAARKAAAYYRQGASLRVIAPEHSDEMDRLGEGDDPARIERIVDRYDPRHLARAWMVVTATGDPTVDGAVYRDAERRRMWCNAADDPIHCSVILPSVVRKGPITVGISTGGTSPATASWMRRRTQHFVESELLSDASLAAHDVARSVRDEMRANAQPTEIEGWQEALDEFEARLRELLSTGTPLQEVQS
jgi:siroheme synthase-like protein